MLSLDIRKRIEKLRGNSGKSGCVRCATDDQEYSGRNKKYSRNDRRISNIVEGYQQSYRKIKSNVRQRNIVQEKGKRQTL